MLSRPEARGQEANYPTRPVRIGVGTGAGGAADTTARVAAKVLSDALGQTFVVENRPGAQGLVALSSFVKERTDGYNLFMLASSRRCCRRSINCPTTRLTTSRRSRV